MSLTRLHTHVDISLSDNSFFTHFDFHLGNWKIAFSFLLECWVHTSMSWSVLCLITVLQPSLPAAQTIFFLFNFLHTLGDRKKETFYLFYVLIRLLISSNFHKLQALGLLFLLFSSWLAYVIFEDTKQGKTLFTSYGTTLYRMFVLFTTSNNPDVWIPAYK